MRKIYILLMALFSAVMASAQTPASRDTDEEKIVQQCINLKELQPLYGNETQLYVLQKNNLFSDIHPAYKGREISFLDKNQMKSVRPNAYFLFWIFKINEGKAEVSFAYNYTQDTPGAKNFKATLLLEKQGTNWIIKNTQLSW
jgi:hypothetical protein